MTLAEFLLARIAEDAARWNNWAQFREIGAGFRDHLLAECEAKRRIVDVAERMVLDADDPEGGMSIKERWLTGSSSRTILTSLASVYADHPDYGEATSAASSSV